MTNNNKLEVEVNAIAAAVTQFWFKRALEEEWDGYASTTIFNASPMTRYAMGVGRRFRHNWQWSDTAKAEVDRGFNSEGLYKALGGTGEFHEFKVDPEKWWVETHPQYA